MDNNNAAEKSKLKQEKKQLKADEKKQKQEIKKRAKEISKKEAEIDDDEERGGGFSSFIVTTVIVVVWIAILCFLIKLDVGGFGSEILTPLLKDVPVINKILPEGSSETETSDEGAYGGYTSLKEAVDYIKTLETELEHSTTVNNANAEEITTLKAEVERLQEFETMQVEFQRIKEQFYEEVIYAENGPGAEAYKEYYESMDPTTAEALYKQVITKLEEDEEVTDYAAAYSAMKPKAAAGIFESMIDDGNIKLVARILNVMDSDSRGDILEVMDSAKAAKVTEIMDPES